MTRSKREYVRNILPLFAIFSKRVTIIAIRGLNSVNHGPIV